MHFYTPKNGHQYLHSKGDTANGFSRFTIS